MAKFGVFAAALRAGEISLAIAGILSALVAAFFYLKVVVVLYMKEPSGQNDVRSLNVTETLALVTTGAATLLLGVHPQPFLDLLDNILI